MPLFGNWQVLIDCSTFLSAAFYPLGKPYQVLARWVKREYDVVITEEIYNEYQSKIADFARRVKKDPRQADKWFKLIDRRAIFVKPVAVPEDSCRDPNDLKYLEAAKSAEADYLIASDKDLLVLKNFGPTKVVTPAGFLGESRKR